MKENIYNANIPWMPTCWVAGGRVQQLVDMVEGGLKRESAIKATAAILRAMRK